MFWPFKKHQTPTSLQDTPPSLSPLKVVIVGSDLALTLPVKEIISNALKKIPLFLVSTQDEQIFEDFLNLNNQNFFDFWDSGTKTLKQYQADVLIYLYQEKNNIRLNFQTEKMYQTSTPPFFSLLQGLYLPTAYFTQPEIPSQIINLIAATLIALNLEKDERYHAPLEQIVKILSKNKIPEGIDKKFISEMLNLLALNYISTKASHFEKQDFKLILNLITFAYKNLNSTYDSLCEGFLLTTLGEAYQCALTGKKADSYQLIQRAIESYKKALKHFSRYIFPYDYGRLCLSLSDLYFKFFQLSADNQTLRDTVFYLREAEKIFTPSVFPDLWAKIQHLLASDLSILSSHSNSVEIANLAIQKFQNEQHIFQKQTHPQQWANIEIQIANIYYYLGKNNSSKSLLEKSINHYSYAFEVYDLIHQNDKTLEIETYIQKADEEIMRLN